MSIAVAKRLAAAGLAPIAERIAAQHDVPLATLLSVTGRVSQAQAALFRAIPREPAEIASLLGWGEAAVRRELGVPEAPKSGPRLRPVRRRRRVVRTVARPQDLAKLVEAAVAPLRAKIADLQRKLAVAPDAPATVEQHLATLGAVGEIIRRAAERMGVGLADLYSEARPKRIVRAREEIVRVLTVERRMSQQDIAHALRIDHTTVFAAQRRVGVKAAYSAGAPRKAAA